MIMNTVTVKNITKYYGSQCVLNNVNFTLNQGEITGFLGPNGAGKTTMMNILTGYLQEWTGEVSVFGRDIRQESLSIRKDIGYLPENNPIDEQLYVKEYLQHIAKFYLPEKLAKTAVKEVIKKVALGDEQHKKIGQLSKGYKQRVGLAQALVHNPKVLILDEPTTGLDPNQLEIIRKLIREEGKDKIVLLSTHIMQEVEALCDRTLILKKGKLVSDSKNATALQTVKVIFAAPINNLQLPFQADIEHISPNSFLINSDSTADIRPLLFEFAKQNQLTLLHLAEETKNTDKLFKEQTQ